MRRLLILLALFSVSSYAELPYTFTVVDFVCADQKAQSNIDCSQKYEKIYLTQDGGTEAEPLKLCVYYYSDGVAKGKDCFQTMTIDNSHVSVNAKLEVSDQMFVFNSNYLEKSGSHQRILDYQLLPTGNGYILYWEITESSGGSTSTQNGRFYLDL